MRSRTKTPSLNKAVTVSPTQMNSSRKWTMTLNTFPVTPNIWDSRAKMTNTCNKSTYLTTLNTRCTCKKNYPRKTSKTYQWIK